ncbi:MAG: Glutamyl-tRNA(Gln) amidotransferase subunit [Bacteroidota bacterium]|jgi:aspartyl-tRNA(Asn)/glutamyl-tRNA(Gln) amidotransferase subunit C
MTIRDIHTIADLARLRFTDAQAEVFLQEFEKIIASISVLDGVDMTNVEPMTSITPQENVFRDDVAGETVSTADALRNAPKKNEAFIKVPKVLG